MIIDDITETIGNTPLLRIPAGVTGLKNISLYAKLEFFNPFGSLKDRIAWGMLRNELPRIKEAAQGIIENSSGNTAKAIAVLARRAGIPFKVVSALLRVKESKDMLRLLGVELEEVSGAVSCFDPSDPRDPQNLIAREVAQSRGKLFFTSQFTNQLNPQTHKETTAEEILRDLGPVDYFCSGLGTAGSTLGIAERLKEVNPKMTLVGIAAGKSDFIPGIRTIDQLLEAGIFTPEKYDEIVTVESGAAIDGVLTLIRECAVLAGPSSGAHLVGSLNYLRKIDATLARPATAVTIVCDRVEWYLSYLRERRPELFAERPKPLSIYSLPSSALLNAASISFKNTEQWVEEQKALVVDIRAAVAFEYGSFPGAINIPGEILEKLLDARNPFAGAETPVLFVCPVGEQSRRFAAQLTRLGGKGYSLEGGLMAWRSFNPGRASNVCE
ncbi:MAG: pyridoxal-phosphate dependent enzyme [Deltaproteobacteria bacterium]|nr:pyridoxal-phosphate dependent enzyme [Deltaproteobacteria bacterium]